MAKQWTAQEVMDLGVRTNLETAASVLGMSRPTAYELIRQNTFPAPVFRVGKKYVVPVAGLLNTLGIDVEPRQLTA